MNDDFNTASKRISTSVILGSLIIAGSILVSSPIGFGLVSDFAQPLTIIFGLLIIVGIIAALMGTGLAKVANKTRKSSTTKK